MEGKTINGNLLDATWAVKNIASGSDIIICNATFIQLFADIIAHHTRIAVQWQHAGLFAATLASTDALAVSSIVRPVGAPEDITVLMEGESLLNDASSLVLFTVFLSAVKALGGRNADATSAALGPNAILPAMGMELIRLSLGGAVVGAVLGWLTLKLLRMLRHAGPSISHQVGLIQAMSYITFYTAETPPFGVSGVIAVVCFGLYGAASSKFELGHSGAAPEMDAVHETLATLFNGVAFFLGGATAANFLLRAASSLGPVLLRSIWAVPVIYAGLFTVRAACIYLFNGIFWSLGIAAFPRRSLPFVTWGGLRGALSLIMAMVIVAEQRKDEDSGGGIGAAAGDGSDLIITAQMVSWTSAIVLMTMCLNAPTLPAVMQCCGLLEVPLPKAALLKRAYRSLARKTNEVIESLKNGKIDVTDSSVCIIAYN